MYLQLVYINLERAAGQCSAREGQPGSVTIGLFLLPQLPFHAGEVGTWF
jgi:hypothetical protein